MRSVFHRIPAALAAIGLAVALPATAMACAYPSAGDIAIPRGETATKQDMVDTQQRVKAYVAAVEEYLACLQAEIDSTEADEETMAEILRIHNSRHNAAVDAMDAVAESFNVQVRAYKQANR